jgi:hypothetical protein
VQSQTTFAVLGKGEDGEFEVRVLKQKIWVEGVSYELQVRTLRPDLRESQCIEVALLLVQAQCRRGASLWRAQGMVRRFPSRPMIGSCKLL